METISIIIPTLNESENIDSLLEMILFHESCLQLDKEIIVVDDGSEDDTRQRVQRWQEQYPVKLLARDGKLGLASAVIDGAKEAKGDIVVVMDADFSHPPEKIPELIQPIKDGTHDMAIGSRYIQGGSTEEWCFTRTMISKIANLLAWPLTDISDPMSGFFAVNRKRLEEIKNGVPGFKIALELLARGGDSMKVTEIPIRFRDRQKGKSKWGLRAIWDYLHQLLVLTGGNFSTGSTISFILTGFLGFFIDLSLFQILLSKGMALGTAHILSFLIATIFNFLLNTRWSFLKSNGECFPVAPGRYTAFLIVALLALFIRGGILAALTQMCGFPARVAMVAAIGAAALVNYCGSAFFIFSRDESSTLSNVRWRLLALGIIGYTIILRLIYLGMPELLQQEAYYWNYAQHLDIGYLDHPPLVAWIIWLSTSVLGNNEFAIRIGAFGCWLLTAFFSYGLARRLFNKSTALLAVLLVSTLPFYFGVSLIMTPDAPMVACWAGAIYFLQQALLDEKPLAWTGAGVCIGLGMLAKYSIALIWPATLLFILIDRRSRRWLLKPEPYLAVLIALVLFSPVIFWNANHDWASFWFQGPRRIQGDFHFSLHYLVLYNMVFLTPTGVAAILLVIMSKWINKLGHCYDLQIPWKRIHSFSIIFSLFPLAVFLVFSVFKTVKLNWTGPVWLGMIPLMAYQMRSGAEFQGGGLLRIIQSAWPKTIVTTLLLYGIGFHYLVLGLPGLAYPENFLLLGWRDFGRQIEEVEEQFENRTGEEPLVIGMDRYKIASGLAFYRTMAVEERPGLCLDKEGVLYTGGRHLFGGNSLMYNYWLPEKEQESRDVIIVSRNPDDLTTPFILSHFHKTGEVHEIVIRKNNMVVGKYYYSYAEKYIPS
jgi:dolichol-phosphate mannosyltransferase